MWGCMEMEVEDQDLMNECGVELDSRKVFGG